MWTGQSVQKLVLFGKKNKYCIKIDALTKR